MWHPAQRSRLDVLAIVGPQDPKRGPTKREGLLQHRIEHRSEIAGRGVDDLQDLGGCGLLLQGLARLGDQPRIFHRDHRLGGEILQQSDLLVRERADFLAIGRDRAEHRIVFAKRHRDRATSFAQFEKRTERWISSAVSLVGGNVDKMSDAFSGGNASEPAKWHRPERCL